MGGTEVSLGLGQYILLYAIMAIVVVAVLGVLFGAALGGAVVFALALVVGVMVVYAILHRGYMYLLHGSTRAGGRD